MTDNDFLFKWDKRFKRNDRFLIQPEDFQEFAQDVRLLVAGRDGAGILFLADGRALLSPAYLALLAAGKLLWLFDGATTPTPPPTPTPGQRTTILLADKGVKGDGVLDANDDLLSGTDSATALMTLRQQLATATPYRQQPALTLVAPAGGVVSYSQNNWADKYRDFILDLNGGTLRPVYGGNDNFLQCTLRNAELLQTNGDGYVGTKFYMTGVRFHTAPIGSTSLTVIDPRQLDPALFFPGAWVKLYSRERVLGENAYPPATDDEAVFLDAVDYATGEVKFHPATIFEHREDWPENAQTAGGGSGRARMISLDHPERLYCEYAEFRNGTMLSASRSAPGAIAFRANKVVYDRITTHQGGTATESFDTLFLDSDLGEEFEDDKGNWYVRRVNTRTRGFISNGNGCLGVTIHGGRSDKSIQLAAKLVEVLDAECWAEEFYTDSGTRLHDVDPCVASYVGFHLTRQYIVGRLRLGATNKTTSYLDPALYEEYTVLLVDAGRIVVEWDGSGNRQMQLFWRGITIGTPIYTIDGAKGGRVTAFDFEGIGDCTTGRWYLTIGGVTPVVGEVYVFSNVLNVIDYGGHTILTPQHSARLWGFDNLRWKGNQGGTPGAPGQLVLTKADLFFKNGAPVAYFRLCGKPKRVGLNAPTAALSGRLLVAGTNKAQSVGVELVSFDLTQTGIRYAGSAGASTSMTATMASSVSLNQYRPAGFGVFAFTMGIVFDGIPYAQIPDDLQLIIDTDYF